MGFRGYVRSNIAAGLGMPLQAKFSTDGDSKVVAGASLVYVCHSFPLGLLD